MDGLTDEVTKIVERRLNELHVNAKPLPAEELKARFGRQQVSEPALHFEIALDGTACALTVTVLDQDQVDDYGPVRAVSEEVGRLQAAGRFVAYHQVMVAPRGTVLLDLVAPGQSAPAPEGSAERFLQGLLDHATVRPLLK
jgi:hypothetical protein